MRIRHYLNVLFSFQTYIIIIYLKQSTYYACYWFYKFISLLFCAITIDEDDVTKRLGILNPCRTILYLHISKCFNESFPNQNGILN